MKKISSGVLTPDSSRRGAGHRGVILMGKKSGDSGEMIFPRTPAVCRVMIDPWCPLFASLVRPNIGGRIFTHQ